MRHPTFENSIHSLALAQFDQRLFRVLAIGVIRFRRVDPSQPDACVADHDGIAVHNITPPLDRDPMCLGRDRMGKSANFVPSGGKDGRSASKFRPVHRGQLFMYHMVARRRSAGKKSSQNQSQQAHGNALSIPGKDLRNGEDSSTAGLCAQRDKHANWQRAMNCGKRRLRLKRGPHD